MGSVPEALRSKLDALKNAGGDVTVFNVSLVCAAAPQIGCGTLAKPILVRIEKETSVCEAWLNRAGTRLAIVWASGIESGDAKSVLSILRDRGIRAEEIVGVDVRQALAAFRSGRDWYRATEIDALSEEEADVIAGRLVRRLAQRVILTADEVKRLTGALRSECARILTQADGASAVERADQIAIRLPLISSDLLDSAGLRALQEVVALGHRPLAGET